MVFDNYAVTFLPPNIAVIIKQEKGEYKVSQKITINEINLYSQFKVYKFNQRAMVIVNNPQNATNRAFIVSDKEYFEIKIGDSGIISHFEANGEEFFTAEYDGGAHRYIYSESQKSAQLVVSYDRETFKDFTSNLYLVDINIQNLKK